jgi:manganese transport protein
MPKRLSFRQGLSSILFWSIISAAFIGPGTVTIAARAGTDFRMQLLWALVFSIFATIVLQEAAARITIASGKNLGQIVASQFSEGRARRLRWVLFGAVAFGCTAYQAGNLLGALSGLALIDDLSQVWATLVLGAVCFGFLWIGNFKQIARLLGFVVALMGLVFLAVALQSDVRAFELVEGTFRLAIPEGGAILVIGLIGTTIVPYNLFLASGISQGQDVREMRTGLVLAILIGGLISVAIMVVGSQLYGTFSFAGLAEALREQLGRFATLFFSFGLFAAGLSSSITAPLAAAITAQSLLGEGQPRWQVRGRSFRMVWMLVLGVGLLFGILDVQPIPAIILAQAINGLLLPIITAFLYMAVNDRALLGEQYANKPMANLLMLLIVGITCFLGLNNVWKAIDRSLQLEMGQSTAVLWSLGVLSVVLVVALGTRVRRGR